MKSNYVGKRVWSKMNYETDAEIQRRLLNHYDEALEIYNPDKIVGICIRNTTAIKVIITAIKMTMVAINPLFFIILFPFYNTFTYFANTIFIYNTFNICKWIHISILT